MINKKSFDVRIWPGIFTKLVLPIQAAIMPTLQFLLPSLEFFFIQSILHCANSNKIIQYQAVFMLNLPQENYSCLIYQTSSSYANIGK